jgi:predicted DCC family thiol-disulfide oxidoreductase YuxK
VIVKQSKAIKNTERIIIFDGLCNLCTRLTRLIIRKDRKRKFIFVSFQSERGQLLLKEHGLPVNDVDSVVYIKNDRCFLRSSAIIHLFTELGGTWKSFCILLIIPNFIRDFIYKIIAKTRYRIFGRHDTCIC